MSAEVQWVNDPILGKRWVTVCPFHGVMGRWRLKSQAEMAAGRHAECQDPGAEDVESIDATGDGLREASSDPR